jgi:predicted nucleic acid-binding protein
MISGLDTTFLVELEIEQSPNHQAAIQLFRQQLCPQEPSFALAPQVLTEFIHIVTDPRRFEAPLSPPRALERAEFWWFAQEVQQIMPSEQSTALFLRWMSQYHLGRKRILDTFLAATYFSANISLLISSNARDFSIYRDITVLTP